MDLNDLIGPQDVLTGVKASCKKSLIQGLAEKAARKTGLDQAVIATTLLEREKLGSTGVGNGIAIPHGKFAQLNEVEGMVAILSKPVDFEALDDEPVDVVVLLLAPEEAGADHLKALARIARTLKQPGLLEELRQVSDPKEAFDLLSGKEKPHAA